MSGHNFGRGARKKGLGRPRTQCAGPELKRSMRSAAASSVTWTLRYGSRPCLSEQRRPGHDVEGKNTATSTSGRVRRRLSWDSQLSRHGATLLPIPRPIAPSRHPLSRRTERCRRTGERRTENGERRTENTVKNNCLRSDDGWWGSDCPAPSPISARIPSVWISANAEEIPGSGPLVAIQVTGHTGSWKASGLEARGTVDDA